MGGKSVATPGTRSGRCVALLLATLGLLVLSCIPASPRTSGSPSFITARSLEQLVEESTVIAIARFEEAEEARELAMFPGGPSQPQDNVYVLGQAYRLHVERYVKGEGPDAIRVVQAEAWGLRDVLAASASPQEEIEAMRQEALERHHFLPFAPDTTYLLFLSPLWRDVDSDYLTGTRHPYRFVLAEDGQAYPDSPWDGAELSFPPRPAEELLDEIERLMVGAPAATPSLHFVTSASPEEIKEEMRATPTVPGEVRLRTYMTAEARGELTLVNGCLYIQAIDAPNRQLLIWPPELYALDEREGTVRILDARSGEELVRVGDRIRIGGGQVAYEHLSDRVRAQLPADCLGPYWIVGLGVKRWEPTPTPGAPGGYSPTSGSADEIEAAPTPDPQATTIILAGEEAPRRAAMPRSTPGWWASASMRRCAGTRYRGRSTGWGRSWRRKSGTPSPGCGSSTPRSTASWCVSPGTGRRRSSATLRSTRMPRSWRCVVPI